jgi:hypothetical protein
MRRGRDRSRRDCRSGLGSRRDRALRADTAHSWPVCCATFCAPRDGRLGYHQVAGNRWSRATDETREATVDLLAPSDRTRLRSSARHGGTNTTEVGGLALALKRPAVAIVGTVKLTDGIELPLDLSIPDVPSMLGLKVHPRRVRDEDRDAVDL